MDTETSDAVGAHGWRQRSKMIEQPVDALTWPN
jgi:hypothetical protein